MSFSEKMKIQLDVHRTLMDVSLAALTNYSKFLEYMNNANTMYTLCYLFGFSIGVFNTIDQCKLQSKSPIANLFTGFFSAYINVGILNLFLWLFDIGQDKLFLISIIYGSSLTSVLLRTTVYHTKMLYRLLFNSVI